MAKAIHHYIAGLFRLSSLFTKPVVGDAFRRAERDQGVRSRCLSLVGNSNSSILVV